MAKDCAGCRSLAAIDSGAQAPAFLEPILWPSQCERTAGAQAYACVACGQCWVDLASTRRRFVAVTLDPVAAHFPVAVPHLHSGTTHRMAPARRRSGREPTSQIQHA